MLLRCIKNVFGRLRGFTGCPNCGDNFWWKANEGLWYEEWWDSRERPLGNLTLTGIGGASGISLCKACIACPMSLDEERIVAILLARGWAPEKAFKVQSAVAAFKMAWAA